MRTNPVLSLRHGGLSAPDMLKHLVLLRNLMPNWRRPHAECGLGRFCRHVHGSPRKETYCYLARKQGSSVATNPPGDPSMLAGLGLLKPMPWMAVQRPRSRSSKQRPRTSCDSKCHECPLLLEENPRTCLVWLRATKREPIIFVRFNGKTSASSKHIIKHIIQ